VECEVLRPSGKTATTYIIEGDDGVPTAEDIAAAHRGFEFAIPLDKPSVRYIRLVITQTWNYYKYMRISYDELEFYHVNP
jgi:hypothetical protein